MRLNKIMAIDGNHTLYRSLSVESIYNLRSSRGERTGGLFGFIRSLAYELNTYKYFPIVCWDHGLSPRRVKLYPQYKHADERSENVFESEEEEEFTAVFRNQRSEIMTFLEICGIPSIRVSGWEGDDLLYCISRLAQDCIILTDDKDLLQLLSPSVKVRRAIAGEFWTLDSYLKSWQDEGYDITDIRQIVYLKAILGDVSDNVPPLSTWAERGKGIGEVNGVKITSIIRDNPNPEDYLRVLNESGNPRYEFFTKVHDKYLINMGLVDLSLVEITDEIKQIIESSILTCKQRVDYFSVLRYLGSKEIKEFNTDDFISNLSMARRNIFVE